jgi:WD40 repeat protein
MLTRRTAFKLLRISLALCLAFVLVNRTRTTQAADAKREESAPVSYYREVRRIFQQHCQGCHQPAKAQGGFIMIGYADLLSKGDSGEPGIVPGKPDGSHILAQITPHDGKATMPKGKDPLPDHEIALIRKWIAQGARDDTPPSARDTADAEHPPKYVLPPVITALDYSPDGTILAVSGYHEVLLHRTGITPLVARLNAFVDRMPFLRTHLTRIVDGVATWDQRRHEREPSLIARLVGLSERIQSIAFSPDGKWLAVTGGDPARFGEIQIWEVVHRKLKLSVPVTFDTVYGASWSPDGSKVAFGCGDNTLRAIDAKTGKQVLYQGAHNDWVLDTAFSKDGSYLVSVSRDRSMKLTEVATQRFIDNITSITPGALKGGLMTVARRPRSDDLLIGGADGVPKIYKMHRDKSRVIGDDFNLIRSFEPMLGRIFTARFNRAGSLLAAGSSLEGRGEGRIYETDSGKLVTKLAGVNGAIYAIVFRPDGKEIASAGFDGVVRLNQPDTGKLIKEFVPVPLQSSGPVISARK